MHDTMEATGYTTTEGTIITTATGVTRATRVTGEDTCGVESFIVGRRNKTRGTESFMETKTFTTEEPISTTASTEGQQT